MGWLDHRELRIVKGVYIAPGDSNSIEPAIVELNLLSNNTGIALTSDGWSPNIPALKNGGVWADSPVSDGRTLISGVNSNVTETMRLVITGGTYKEAAGYLAALNNMIRDCRDFWQSNAQINPVYLQWYASCGEGKQYALIYNMDFDAEYKDSPTPQIEGTLTIEREYYWRFIPPGASPMQWRYEYYNQPYDYAKSNPGNMGSSTNDLIQSGSLKNRSEWTSNALNSLVTNNCVTVAANLIPGDAPALMTLFNTSTTRNNYIMGKKTVKINVKDATGLVAQNAIFNCNDGTLGTDATLANDTGSSLAAGAGTAQRVSISFATATNQLRWNIGTTLIYNASVNRLIGRWMVFLRCRQSAGSVGDITMYLRYGAAIASNTDGVKLNVVSPPITTGGTGNSTDWGLVYMGIITIPYSNSKGAINQGGNAPAGGGANGLASDGSSFDIGLFALRSTGTAVLYLNDLVLIPIDEGSITLEGADTTVDAGILYDETAYYTHGVNEIVFNNAGSTAGAQKAAKMTGTGIQLTPNIENRLYFMFYDSSLQSRVTDTVAFNINIVPRCVGIRGYKNING